MRTRLLFVLVPVLLLTAGGNAHAARFGTDESIHRLQDVDLKGPNDEALYLGHKTSTLNVLAGVYIKDDGYVLGVRGDSKKYFDMPGAADVERFQRSGLLPNPLPKYELSAIDYVLGYSLWIVLAVVALWVAWDWARKRRTEQEPA